MRKINIDFIKSGKKFGYYLVKGVKIIIPIVGIAALGKFKDECEVSFSINQPTNVIYLDDEVSGEYGEAVSAVANSTMTSFYKKEAIQYIEKNATTDYYKGVISIAKSDMSDFYKKEAIVNLK